MEEWKPNLTPEKIDKVLSQLAELIDSIPDDEGVFPDVALIIHFGNAQSGEMFATGTMGPQLCEFLQFTIDRILEEDQKTIQ